MSTKPTLRPPLARLAGLLLVGALASAQGYKLSLPMPPGPVAGDITAIELAPDGRALAYLADQDVDELFELYVVAADGASEPVKVSGALLPGRHVRDFGFTPDGARVLFLADPEVFGVDQALQRARRRQRCAGARERRAGGERSRARLRRGPRLRARRLRADPEGDGSFELYSGLVAGGEPLGS